MIIKFCENCDNLLYLYTDDKQGIYLACKTCGNIEDYDSNENKSTIINNKETLEIDKFLNINSNFTNDITLPQIKNNKNIKCINSECESVQKKMQSKITYIKYDNDNLKYIYICQYCGKKWKNK